MTSYLQYSLTLTCIILSFPQPLLVTTIPQSDGKPNPHGLLPPGASTKLPRKMFNGDAENTCPNWGSQMLDEEQQVHTDLLRDVWAPHPASKTEPLLQSHDRLTVTFWELCLLARCTLLLQGIDIASTSLQIPCWSICQSPSPRWTRPSDMWTPKLITYLINCYILRCIVCVADCQQTHLVLAWIQNVQKTVQKH